MRSKGVTQRRIHRSQKRWLRSVGKLFKSGRNTMHRDCSGATSDTMNQESVQTQGRQTKPQIHQRYRVRV